MWIVKVTNTDNFENFGQIMSCLFSNHKTKENFQKKQHQVERFKKMLGWSFSIFYHINVFPHFWSIKKHGSKNFQIFHY